LLRGGIRAIFAAMPKTAFVTGATGFVGLNLIEELLKGGWQVTAMHRANSDLTYLKRMDAARVVGDITDAASVRQAMPAGVDVVFHVAADTGLWSGNNVRQDRINIDGTRNTVEAALAAGARRFVHTSSVSAFGIQNGRIDETSPRLGAESPINYQRSKYFAEEEVRGAIGRGLDAVILCPAGIVGPYDTHNYARLFRLIAERKLPGVTPGTLSVCHVREVARAHVTAAERSNTGEAALLAGTDASVLELIQEIGAALGRPVPNRPTPAWLIRMAGRVGALKGALTGRAPEVTPEIVRLGLRYFTCDSSKAMRELGLRAVPLKDMVADCAEWMVAEGRLPGVELPGRRQ
jgi:nucleoside-diphosphate-sugar epimerase